MAADFELARASVAVEFDDKSLNSGLDKANQTIKSKLGGAMEDHPAIEKILFGRHGAEGMSHTIEHSVIKGILGPLARGFMMGGALGLITHEVVELGMHFLETATGADKSAEATKRAAEALEEYKKAVERSFDASKKLNELRKEQEKPSALNQAKEVVSGSLSPDERIVKKIEDREKEIKALREKAAAELDAGQKYKPTEEEHQQNVRFAEEKSGLSKNSALASLVENPKWKDAAASDEVKKQRKVFFDTLNEVESTPQKQHQGAYDALTAQADAKEAEQKTSLADLARNQVVKHFGERGTTLGGLAGMAGEAIGTARDNLGMAGGQIGSSMKGAGSTVGEMLWRMMNPQLAAVTSQLDANAKEAARKAPNGEQLEKSSDSFLDRMKQAKLNPSGRIGAGDVGDIGSQIQQALLEPSPFEREGRELQKQQLDALLKINDGLGNAQPKADVARFAAGAQAVA